MSDYNVNAVINQVMYRDINHTTGEITNEYTQNEAVVRKNYLGPRKFDRVMEMYDEACIKLSSKAGIKLLVYIKQRMDTESYRIELRPSWLAKDLDVSRDAIINNIKKLVDNKYAIKEGDRGRYFINPEFLWTQISDYEWQQLKQEFKYNLTNRYNPSPKDIT